MRLIDADALKAEWYRLNDINEEDCGARFVGYQEIARLINNAPTVEPTGDYISRADAIEAVAQQWLFEASVESPYVNDDDIDEYRELAEELFEDVPSAEAEWIPCSERLPKINQRVLLATNEERVFVGYKEKPDIVWRVTEADGREHWVYDPENYTDDIDVLPKDEDCGFAKDDVYADGFLSVTSINYDDRFEGVIAWMPLPEPYKAESEAEE